MEFGLALHLGEVLYGNIGASDRLDFTVVGPAVNEASRIQSLCKPLDCSILVSRAVRETAGGEAGLESLGYHELRGVRQPQELFQARRLKRAGLERRRRFAGTLGKPWYLSVVRSSLTCGEPTFGP